MEIKILLVEDNPLDARLFKHLLRDIDEIKCEIDFAITLSEALNKLGKGYYDVVIADLGLPDSFGLDTYYEIHTRFPDKPCIILSGMSNEDIARKAVEEGAHDFLVKGKINPKILSRSIRYAIKRQETRTNISSMSGVSPVSPKPREKTTSVNNIGSEPNKFISTILRRYESILKDMLAANLKKGSKQVEDLKKLAGEMQAAGFKPDNLEDIRDMQKIVPPTHELLYLLNIDIASEMVALAYKNCFKTKLLEIKEVEYQ